MAAAWLLLALAFVLARPAVGRRAGQRRAADEGLSVPTELTREEAV